MRGKALENGGGSLDVRITPACAGKSHFATNFHLNKRDHPSMCGEKWFLPSRSVRDRGSPPHVRGKARQQEHLAAQSGITPACAGKSREYRVSDERSLGSPPRMRGKVNVTVVVLRGNGITPAYAGKSPDRILWEHWKEGSPPHVRGKAAFGRECYYPYGITPACAGKRQALAKALSRSRDHPRMCGEKTKKIP